MQVAVQFIPWRMRWCLLLLTMVLQTTQAQTSLQLVSSNPVNNAIGVDRGADIILVFSENIDPQSVTASHVKLRHGDLAESITVDVSANQLSIRSAHPLQPGTIYILGVSGLQSTEGDLQGAAVSVVFTTIDGTWQPPQQVTTGSQYLQSSKLAFSKQDGTAMVVWTEHTGTLRTDLFASRYASGQWSAPQLVNTNAQGEVFDASIAVGTDGVAVAVWEECYTDDSGGIHFRIWGNVFTVSNGWAMPQPISNEAAQGGFSPQVAMSSNGEVIALWYQYDHGTGRIFSSRYNAQEGWREAMTIDAVSKAPGSFNPHIAFDNKGNAYAVWQQWWHGVTLIWANRYVAGRGWIAPQIIQTDKTANSDASQLAFDANGNALAVWTQSGQVFTSRYALDQGWSASTAISNGIEGYQPTVSVNGSGDAFAAWTQVVVTGTDEHGIPHTRGINWVNNFTTNGGWQTPTLLQDANGFNSGDVSLASDDAGNALAIWSESNGSFYRIYTNRYQANVGWVRRKVIDTTNTVAATNPHVVVDANGSALAVWEQVDAAGNVGIWSSRFE